jgi:hypothetical protein
MALLVVPALAQAQTTGTMCGTVTDASGAPVPGVTVTMTRDAKTPNVVTTTRATGDFMFSSVPVGTYTLSFQLSGFKKAVRPGVVVQATRERRVDQQIEPALIGAEQSGSGVALTKKIVTSSPPLPCSAPR